MSTARDDLTIRAATVADADAVAAIYDHYVTRTIVTFEEEPVPASEMALRIQNTTALSLPWLIAERQGGVVGYAYARPWRERRAYRFSAEITVYVVPSSTGRGIGSRLYEKLLPLVQDRGIHAVVGVIALPNEASVALHEKFGLSKVAHLREVGFKFDRWIDVGYWERIL
ncbi:MAG TPA: arsinothricin resistance N-acetyltransferase ArsN1 family B [Gemmatimonadaceae bacterium]|nr:arsinothricin resistance N-acetyltransferase ArsN1 family B [Gemmatimonadaceae bacterium]